MQPAMIPDLFVSARHGTVAGRELPADQNAAVKSITLSSSRYSPSNYHQATKSYSIEWAALDA
jgi:hypothetical protein